MTVETLDRQDHLARMAAIRPRADHLPITRRAIAFAARRERDREIKESRRTVERERLRQQAEADRAEADRRRARIEAAVAAGMGTLPAHRLRRYSAQDVRRAVEAAVRAAV